MNIKKVIVDEIPLSCVECVLMEYINDKACCMAQDVSIRELAGNPYAMKYRRSDCPLEVQEGRKQWLNG